MAADPPEGFVEASPSAFVTHIGPVFHRPDAAGGEMILGLYVEDKLLNGLRTMHGGVAASIADTAMARATVEATARSVVTVNLAVEYVRAVRAGSWVEAHARVAAVSATEAEAVCEIVSGGRVCVRATARFLLRRPQAS